MRMIIQPPPETHIKGLEEALGEPLNVAPSQAATAPSGLDQDQIRNKVYAAIDANPNPQTSRHART